MKINKDKHIGRVLFIVEGSQTEFSIHYKFIYNDGSSIVTKIVNKFKMILGDKVLSFFYCRGYDVAISFKMGETAKLISDIKSKKICWIHSNVDTLEEKFSYPYNNIEDEIIDLKKFDTLVAVSQKCRSSFIEKYGKQFNPIVIYNPIDYKKILDKSSEKLDFQWEEDLLEDEIPILGTVARIDSQKGIDRLLNISKNLDKLHIPHKMVIIGDGCERDRYEQYKINNHLKNVYFLGFKENPYKYIKYMDIFVCASMWESYSLVINEALALNKLVISTKCGGPQEVLKHGEYGVLTENDETSLFEAVKTAIEEKNYINYNNCYSGENSIKNFINNFYDVIEEII